VEKQSLPSLPFPPCCAFAATVFEASSSFTGKRDGFVFKTGPKGLGTRVSAFCAEGQAGRHRRRSVFVGRLL
jgi:hypothetical protein